jgi:hypothetical protein
MTPEELKEVRAYSEDIRRQPLVDGSLVAKVIDRAVALIVSEGERADLAEARVEELTKAIQAAHDDLRDDLCNYPTESYVRLMDIVPEIMP